MKNDSRHRPVLILGCGRSGTSIFGELFGNLEGYEYLSEPPFADAIQRFGNGLAMKVPTEATEFPPDPGLSFPLKALLGVAPTTRIFWIVRHPLDAVCSLRIGIGQNWRHHPRPADWREWLDKPLIERCAHHWNHINSVGFNTVRELATLVRFEDMIADPMRFAESAVSAAGCECQPNCEAMSRWAERVQDTNNEKFVEAQTSRNHSRRDHSVRVGRWRENLSSQDIRTVISMVADTSEQFGYTLH